MNHANPRSFILAAMFCALVFAATFLMIPVPVGNINLGDGMLLLCAWLLGGPWSIVAAATGAALCDLLSGFVVYAPATFFIKAAMAAAAIGVLRLLKKSRLPSRAAHILSAVSAEGIMIIGYLFYEAVCLSYGVAAFANIPFNAIQGGFGILVSCTAYELLHHIKPHL